MKITKNTLRERVEKKLRVEEGISLAEATKVEIYHALVRSIMEDVSEDWLETKELYKTGKEAFYLSAEFLMGRALGNNLINLGVLEEVRELFEELEIPFNHIEDAEEDAGLGNGGLGRLAACFLDSLVTLNLPGQGYGIRYKNGIFNQKIIDGFQVEEPESWLKYGDPWSTKRIGDSVVVEFGDGPVMAVPYDTPVIGYGTKNVNTLRLWEAEAVKELDLQVFNKQEYDAATREKRKAEDITRVLYPNDSTNEGKKLRLKQQYFFVSASLQDILRKFKKTHGNDFSKLPEVTAIQLNDTHPAIAIPELMRLLVDVEGLEWEKAFGIVQKTCSYTNHTILAEALEKWWFKLYEEVVPRIYEITLKLNEDLVNLLREKFPLDREKQERMAIIQGDLIHMAWLSIYGTHTTNGVAALHTEILKDAELKDWYELFPERFQNKTNGITQRRWLLLSNPQLSSLITELIGDKWITNLSELKNLEKYKDDTEVIERFLKIKAEKKGELANYVKTHQGAELDPNSIFDIQVKRVHEYKRQLLNILHVMDLYNRIKRDPSLEMNPVTYIFGSKAAPGYLRAKGIIKLINEVGARVNNDPIVAGRIKVLFIENYRVSLAEKVFPAADISEQISTAGKEASGTGNMKFMVNGALTLGTLDGANVEIFEEAGIENNIAFGLKIEEVNKLRAEGYDHMKYYNEVEGLKEVIDSLVDGTYSDGGTGYFKDLYDSLLEGASWHAPDEYLVLADFDDYRRAQREANEKFSDRLEWGKMAWMNIANAGKFTSDRTIAQYAKEIWDIEAKKL